MMTNDMRPKSILCAIALAVILSPGCKSSDSVDNSQNGGEGGSGGDGGDGGGQGGKGGKGGNGGSGGKGGSGGGGDGGKGGDAGSGGDGGQGGDGGSGGQGGNAGSGGNGGSGGQGGAGGSGGQGGTGGMEEDEEDVPPDETMPVVTADLLAHYRFNETTGSKTAVDSSGNDQDAVHACASTTPQFAAGKFGRGFVLKENANSFRTPVDLLDGLAQISFSFWMKPDGTYSAPPQWDVWLSQQRAVKEIGDIPVEMNFELGLTTPDACPGQVYGECMNSISGRLWNYWHPQHVDPVGALPTGEWTHVVFIVNADTGRQTLYRNGIQVFDHAYTGEVTTGVPVYIGPKRNNRAYDNCFSPDNFSSGHGVIDDLLIYGKVLSADEVSMIFNAGSNP